MRLYETTFILSPQADDAAFDRQIKSVADLIARYNGKLIEEDRWGVRRLAYPIQKFTQGYYTRMVYRGNNNLLKEMERMFRIEEAYIRYLTVLFEGHIEETEPPEPVAEETSSVAAAPAETSPPPDTPVVEEVSAPETESESDMAAAPPPAESSEASEDETPGKDLL